MSCIHFIYSPVCASFTYMQQVHAVDRNGADQLLWAPIHGENTYEWLRRRVMAAV
jgi:hypothetical protein